MEESNTHNLTSPLTNSAVASQEQERTTWSNARRYLAILSVVAVVAVVAVVFVAAPQSNNKNNSNTNNALNRHVVDYDELMDSDNTTVCWKDSYGRGVGTVPDECPGQDKNGALCYPNCRDGYYGVGPVCWENCPDGWIDEGALCREPGSIKTIAKKSYGRGAGTLMHCSPDKQEQSGLCYTPCTGNYDAVGPVCWAQCSGNNSYDGGAICCLNSTICDDKILSLSTGLPIAVAQAIMSGGDPAKVIQAVKDAINSILGFVMPLCSQIESFEQAFTDYEAFWSTVEA